MHLMSFIKTLSFINNILNSINDFLSPIIQGVTDYLNNIAPWAAGIILLGVAIFLLIGIFVFIKKFIKTFIVLIILGAAIFIVYQYTDLLDNVLKIFN